VLARYRSQVVAPRRGRIRAILDRAQRLGLIDPDADLDVAVTLCTGSWYGRALGEPQPPPNWPARTTALVWRAVGGTPPEAQTHSRADPLSDRHRSCPAMSVSQCRLPGMTDIALFHSVLGVHPGVSEAADRLRAEGHDVVVVDQYGGRVFDDYEEADEFAQAIGYPTLMGLAAEAVRGLPDGFIAAGFSNGGGMAEFVATKRPVRGVLMLSGALDLAMIGTDAWPAGVPAQIHYTTADPFRNQAWIDAVVAQVRSAGASIEVFGYPGAGHLFTDPSLPSEYDAQTADLLWSRVLPFCAAPPQ